MRLFSEKVKPTFTSSNLNILTVKDFEEVFFDVYEFEINGKKFTAEKVTSHNGKPVVDIPVVIDREEYKAPFILERGSFKVEFNKKNKQYIGSAEIELPERLVIEEDEAPVINSKIEDLVIEEGEKTSRMVFDQNVNVSISSTDHNILVVENYDEIYFDIFEIEINGKKYNAERVSTYKSRPVVNVPIIFEDKEYIAPFVLEKGKQEILFNENNLKFVKKVEEEKFELPIYQEEVVEDIVLEKRESILKDIVKARKLAKQYAEDIKLKKIEEANNIIDNNEKQLQLYVEDVKENLTQEFLSIVDKTNNNLITDSKKREKDLTNYVSNYLKEESKNLLDNIETLNENSIAIFENKIQDLVKNVYTKDLTRLVNEKSDNNVATYSKIFNETKDSLEKLLKDNKNNIDSSLEVLKEKIDKDVITLEKSNVDLDNKINKGLNKALSRVGNIKVETLKEVDAKIEVTENKITDIYEITINEVKDELEKSLQDFTYVNEKIENLTKKSSSIENATNEELKDVKSDIVKLKVEKGELEQRILESKELLENSIKKLTKLNKDIVQENKYYLQKEVDKLQKRTQFYSDKANKNNLKNDKEILTFKESVSNELNKTKEDLISSIDSKLEVTNKEIDKILTDRIEEVDNNFREELKAKILESKTQLQDQVNELKDSIPEVVEKEIIIEKNGLPDKDFKLDIKGLEKRISDRFTNEITQIRRYIDTYGGGGGSVAVQTKDSDIDAKSITVTSTTSGIVSAGRDLADIFVTSTQAGDISTVTAGAGLTGGGSSSTVTLNAGEGDGIDVSADSIAVDDTVLRTTGASAVGLSATSTTNGFVSAGRDLADIFAPTSTIITKSGLSDFGTIDSFAVSNQSSGKYAIAVVDSSGGTQFSEISITSDGTNVGIVEYGINSTTPEPFAEYGAIVSSGTVSLTAKGVGASVISNFTFKGNRLNLFTN
jgi:hypothetical protein|tara:strand:- start:546 stop:3386 length:2841 start_codon:yes stop_codon:yes gene_type:complete